MSGCGDPLVDVSYQGQPLFSFRGYIVDTRVGWREAPEQVRVAVLWSPAPNATTLVQVEALVEQRAASLTARFPSSFQMHLFQRPEDAWLRGPDSGRFGVGYPVVYHDRNGNQRCESDEVLGNAWSTAILYAPEPLSAQRSPTDRDLPQGFSLTALPLPCGDSVENPGEDCGVPLGAPCEEDADCGTRGMCLPADDSDIEAQERLYTSLSFGGFPGGYCVVRELITPPNVIDCWPQDSVTVAQQLMAGLEHTWYKACEDDSSCRVQEGYLCHISWGACLPDQPVEIRVETSDRIYFDEVCWQTTP